MNSDITGLPYPADAEIVLEGEMKPGELREEGSVWRVAGVLRQH